MECSKSHKLGITPSDYLCLGPLLFTIYCMPISSIFAKHGVKYHMYADDTQLYVEFPRNRPTDAENATHRIGNCVTDLKRWLTDHQLLLNESKTGAIAFNVPSCKFCLP